jgi:hypothetical protein
VAVGPRKIRYVVDGHASNMAHISPAGSAYHSRALTAPLRRSMQRFSGSFPFLAVGNISFAPPLLKPVVFHSSESEMKIAKSYYESEFLRLKILSCFKPEMRASLRGTALAEIQEWRCSGFPRDKTMKRVWLNYCAPANTVRSILIMPRNPGPPVLLYRDGQRGSLRALFLCSNLRSSNQESWAIA